MKKTIISLLVFSLLIFLSGCQTKEPVEDMGFAFEFDKDMYESIDYLVEQRDNFTYNEYIAATDAIAEHRIAEILSDNTNYSGDHKRIYYISPNGDDKNDGLSPETPFKSLSRLDNLTGNCAILFERGGVWRGSFTAKLNTTVSTYGEGERPVIYGSKMNYADPSLWEETDTPNVYKLKKRINNAGIVVFNNTGVLGNTNELVRQNVKSVKDLKNDLDYCTERSTLYMYSVDKSPAERFESIEIGENDHILKTHGSGITIENIALLYGGGHGVKSDTTAKLTVRNCVFGYIGGSWLSGSTRYGNAVEVFGGAKGFAVKDNYMYQIYDTGATIQCNLGGKCVQKDVSFIGNIIDYCCWGVEFYNTGGIGEKITENFNISYNIIRNTGYGWGRTGVGEAFKSCNINSATDFNVYRNIFNSSIQTLVALQSKPGDLNVQFEDNIYIHELGKKFGSRNGKDYYTSQDLEAILCEQWDGRQINPIFRYKIEENQ